MKASIRSPNAGQLLGPQFANKGVLQGSPFSPILFHIYTASLMDLRTADVKIFQYADTALKLNWLFHIENIANKAIKGIHEIHQLPTWWGSVPLVVNECKGIVRSHLENGTNAIAKTTKANWSKLV